MRLLLAFLFLFACAALEAKPTFEEAISRSGANFEKNKMDEAIIHAEIAKDLKPARPDAYMALSLIYQKIGNRDHALKSLLEGFEKCKIMPDEAVARMHEISVEPMLIITVPKGKKVPLGTRGFRDAAKRDKIVKALKPHPGKFLLFIERFSDENNPAEVLGLLQGFQCPKDLEWLYFYVRAKAFYLLGMDEDCEAVLSQAAKTPPQDARRLYELGKLSVLAGSDDEAQQFLLQAQKKASDTDADLQKKIDQALKHPERFLDDDAPR